MNGPENKLNDSSFGRLYPANETSLLELCQL